MLLVYLGQKKVTMSLCTFYNQAPRADTSRTCHFLSLAAAWLKKAQDLRKVLYMEQEILSGSMQLEISGNFQELKKIIHKCLFPLISEDLPSIFQKLFRVELEHSLTHSSGSGDLATAPGLRDCQEDSSGSVRPPIPSSLSRSAETRDPDHKRCLHRLSGSVNLGQQSWLAALR